ncbi:putative phosphoribulokinase [Helianthus anomalus]
MCTKNMIDHYFMISNVDPQKQYADAVIEVLPTQLIPDDNEGKVLRVKLIMKEGVKYFNPVYLFDEGSTVSWIPCGRKLTCSYPGIKFAYGPDSYFGHEVDTQCFQNLTRQ